VAIGTRDPETPAVVAGSELVTVTRWQARAWEQAIAAAYQPEAPAVRGWNPAGEHGAPAGYDLVLATPRTLSALGWCFFTTDRGVSDEIMRADRTPKQQGDQMAAVARRDRSKRLAADTTEVLDGRSMSKHDLRAELRRLGDLIDQAPRDQSRLLAHATTKREQHEQRFAEATGRMEQARDQLASLERGPARWLRRGDLARARAQSKQTEEAYQVARQAADRERQARQAQQQHQAHREANPDLADRRRELLGVQAWRATRSPRPRPQTRPRP
jgi:hypothetical protein